MVGVVLMGFEILRGFQHCRPGQADETFESFEVACACARACLVVWLSV